MSPDLIDPSSFSPDIRDFIRVGLDDLVRNKEAASRPKDLDDLPFLKEALQVRSGKG